MACRVTHFSETHKTPDGMKYRPVCHQKGAMFGTTDPAFVTCANCKRIINGKAPNAKAEERDSVSSSDGLSADDGGEE